MPFLRNFRVASRCARGFATIQGSGRTAAVSPSGSEIANAKLGPRNLEKAVRHLHEDGLIVIEDIVPHAELDFLNEQMVKDARTLQARGEDGPFNYNLGNLQQDAPPVAKYFFPSIFASTPNTPPVPFIALSSHI